MLSAKSEANDNIYSNYSSEARVKILHQDTVSCSRNRQEDVSFLRAANRPDSSRFKRIHTFNGVSQGSSGIALG